MSIIDEMLVLQESLSQRGLCDLRTRLINTVIGNGFMGCHYVRVVLRVCLPMTSSTPMRASRVIGKALRHG